MPLSACSKENEVKETSEEKQETTVNETQETASKDMTIDDGSFEAVATGHNGEIKLSVTFKDNKIEAIDVKESSETPVVADTGFEEIIARILEHQTSNVDTITGATVTSNAVRSAVSKAIDEANGSEEFKRKVEEEAQEAINLETDVLVIGAGGAGLSAAISADEEGHDVVLQKKMQWQVAIQLYLELSP